MVDHVDSIEVLVIDDNPGDRRLIELALEDGAREAGSQCSVQTADCLNAALQGIEQADHPLDAIILDLGLPDVTGFEGLIQLAGLSQNIPVVVLTGNSDLSAWTEAIKLGASDYLEKGDVQPRPLWRTIRYAIERKKNEAELMLLANTDPLTGVLNRRAFFRQLELTLEQARRTELACALIVVDINDFKAVNDVHGHATGDALLKEVANRFSSLLRETDSVGRLGGDEFAIIAPNLKTANAAIEIAEKLRTTVSQIGQLQGKELSPSISVGIAVYPMDDSPADILVTHADLALYKSKDKKNGPTNYYDEHMDREAKARHAIRKSMLGDINQGRFFLHYQPIVDAITGVVAGAEALARWRDPNNNLIPPSEFIPIAEESGWIGTLGLRLLEESCKDIRGLLESGIELTSISLNVSAVQCRDPQFALQLVGAILKSEIDPKLINVEITESTIISNLEITAQNLERLKEVGVGVHLDDFGTGYSSLSVLKDLPLDVLKIDRSFVTEMVKDDDARQIVEAIAELSRKLHFKTIAEGVETKQQAEHLRDIGVDYLQGFYFSRPVGIDEFRGMLSSSKPLGNIDHAVLPQAPDQRQTA